MNRSLNILLALSISVAPLLVQSLNQPIMGQNQNSQSEQVQQFLNQAQEQVNQGNELEAIKIYEKALAVARSINDREKETKALKSIGLRYYRFDQYTKAVDYLKQALKLSREFGYRTEEFYILKYLAWVYEATNQYDQALAHYTQTLAILRELKYRSSEAEVLNDIGETFINLGKLEDAMTAFRQALPISREREVQDREEEFKALKGIGSVYFAQGKPQKALDSLNQALSIAKATKNHSQEAEVLNSIGFSYQNLGQTQNALDVFNQALSASRQAKDQVEEVNALLGMGLANVNRSQFQEALDTFNQGLILAQKLNYSFQMAILQTNIGAVYVVLGQPQRALHYANQASTFVEKGSNTLKQATVLKSIAWIYLANEKPREALDSFNKALIILKDSGIPTAEAETLILISQAYFKLEQLQQALSSSQKALIISREIRNRPLEGEALMIIGTSYKSLKKPQESLQALNKALLIQRELGNRFGEAGTLFVMGEIYRNQGRYKEAISYLENSMDIVLKLRSGLRRNKQDQVRRTYSENFQHIAGTLATLLLKQKQPDKAYEWINLVATAELADYTRLVNPRVRNPQAQLEIKAWNQNHQQVERLRQQLNLNFSEDLSREISELEAQMIQEAEGIYSRFSEAAELFETKVTDINLLKSSIPAGTVVIHPILTTTAEGLPDTITIFVLSREKGLSAVKQIPINPAEFEYLLSQTYSKISDFDNDEYYSNLSKLYNLLIRPIEAEIQSTNPKQLSIIPSGKLRYIPFEALYRCADTSCNTRDGKYLIEKYPINYLTRLSTRALAAKGNVPVSKQVLAIGNPVPTGKQSLAGAETEAKQIAEISPGSKAMIHDKATLKDFKLLAPKFSRLHLATHGCFQKGGCPNLDMEENTLLFAEENLNIADAALLGLEKVDLITLSACQTALQTNSNGEEIAGLAYLFERAGAKSVIASLWNVKDKTTQDIMVQFYKNLNQGMSKAEALRQAKLSHIKKSPAWWAPLVLIGDAR